jgi:uncharacterized protein (TIGR04222 family)
MRPDTRFKPLACWPVALHYVLIGRVVTMNYPWGISGPQFLVMYGVGLVLALVWALWLRYRVRRPEPPAPGLRVGVAELAFLAGGPRRVVEVAIARLVETGQIHVARSGLLTAANTTNDDDRVQEAVLREVGRRPRTTWSVVGNVLDGSAVATIGDRLVERRLLVAPAQATAVRKRAVLGLYAVGAIGVVRFGDGLRLGRPVGYLFVLLLLTAALTILLLRRRIKARTVHGDQVLASARGTDTNEPEPHPAVALAGAGAAVAFGGLVAYPDLAMRSALVPSASNMAATSAATDGSSWSYSSSDSYLNYNSPSRNNGSGGGGSGCGSGGGSGCGGSGGGSGSSGGGGGSGCGGGCGSGS